MEISSKFERLDHAFAFGHMGQNPKLQLAVVGDYELLSFFSDEGFSDLVFVFV